MFAWGVISVRKSVMGQVAMGMGIRLGRGFFMLCAALLLALTVSHEAKATSPLECGMKQMGVRGHIECTVTQGRVEVREVHLNNGECRTMQEHFERNPQEFERLKSMIGYPVSSLDYRHSYRQGQTFTVYIMPCRLHDFMIETDLGTWGWLAQRQ
jgi:hypothetical protein